MRERRLRSQTAVTVAGVDSTARMIGTLGSTASTNVGVVCLVLCYYMYVAAA